MSVPCRGRIMQTLLDAPDGHHWPSDGDQILLDGWIDSVEALRIGGLRLTSRVQRATQGESSSSSFQAGQV